MLLTKLHIPSTGKNLLHRSGLFDKLNEGLSRKLILVSAPAGYGKTTLLCDWISQNKIPTAWFSIDKRDNDLIEFLSIIISGIQTINKTVGKSSLQLLKSPQSINKEFIIELLINDILKVEKDFLLVLDDFHLIESQEIFTFVTYLLKHIPEQFHIAISTRSDPQLPIAKLRSRNELIEIRSNDLNFSANEISTLFNNKYKFGISLDDIYVLQSKTEGWIAGLQLTALSMQGKENISNYIKKLAGDNRYIMDYLIEEVLDNQDEEVKEFLLQSSIFDQISAQLCDAVLNRNDSQLKIEALEKSNMFIIPLDNKRNWYRYHHLFADLLQQRLHITNGNIIAELHRRASTWYSQNGLHDEAVDHALEIQDFERVSSLIVEQADSIWEAGQHYKFQRWLEKIPKDVIFSIPILSILQAECILTTWQLDLAEQNLQNAEKAIENSNDLTTDGSLMEQNQQSSSERKGINGRIAANRALIASFHEDVPAIIQHANQALELLPEHELTWRSIVAITIGDAHFIKGDLVASYQAQLEALDLCKVSGNPFLFIIANANLAVTLRQKGQLQQALKICRQQVEYASKNSMSQLVVVGWFLAIWGEVLAEINDLHGAIDKARKGVELTERHGDVAMLCKSYLCIIRIFYSIGNMVEASKIIDKLENVAQESDLTNNIKSIIEAWKVRIWLAQDKFEMATKLAEKREFQVSEELLVANEIEDIVLARIFLNQYRCDEAINLLDRLIKEAEVGGRINPLIEMYIIKSLALKAQDNKTNAKFLLGKALTLAEPGGYIRIIVDEGEEIKQLLNEILKEKNSKTSNHHNLISIKYTKKLLLAFETEKKQKKIIKEEILSNRELDTLELIAENLSNQEIADKLFISLNTVKTHVSKILDKLYADSRSEAVIKAKEQGII